MIKLIRFSLLSQDIFIQEHSNEKNIPFFIPFLLIFSPSIVFGQSSQDALMSNCAVGEIIVKLKTVLKLPLKTNEIIKR